MTKPIIMDYWKQWKNNYESSLGTLTSINVSEVQLTESVGARSDMMTQSREDLEFCKTFIL